MNLVVGKFFLSALLACLLWCLFCVSTSAQFDSSNLFKLSCLVLFGVTLIRPLLGIGIFLILMPFFGGSKPEDLHTVRCFILLSTTVFAASLYLTYGGVRYGKKIQCNFAHPLVFSLLIYWLIAGLSLSTVVPDTVVLSVLQFQSPLTIDFLNLNEGAAVYPWLAFFALTVTLIFGFVIVNLSKSSEKIFVLMGCYLIGLIITVILGLLDYYDVINLNGIRPSYFEPTFGTDYRFQHLTSVFGNPGWYAQYIVLGAPALLAILVLRWSQKWKIAVLVGLMILTEFCIILIYQRGGWLSYPLTLIIIWFCVYVLNGKTKQSSPHTKAIKGSMLKIAITLPITIVISLSLVYVTARMQPENRQQLSGFAERAKSITDTNDRLKYWEPAFQMAHLHPFFGPGLESFSSQYKKLYIAPGHKYTQTPKYDVAPYYGSAHNLYFQAVAGKGLLGLFSLFGVFLAVLTLVWRGIFSSLAPELALSQSQRILLMMTLAYICALMIYGNVGEIFFSPSGYISFGLFFAVNIAAVPPTYQLSTRFRGWVFALLACAFLAHLYLEFGIHFGN